VAGVNFLYKSEDWGYEGSDGKIPNLRLEVEDDSCRSIGAIRSGGYT
jgi:hypothetical protein